MINLVSITRAEYLLLDEQQFSVMSKVTYTWLRISRHVLPTNITQSNSTILCPKYLHSLELAALLVGFLQLHLIEIPINTLNTKQNQSMLWIFFFLLLLT